MKSISVCFLVLVMSFLVKGQTSCEKCKPPKFQTAPLYLPFCYRGVTYNNVCLAICAGTDPADPKAKPKSGSCDQCEVRECKNKPFAPVCATSDEEDGGVIVFPNQCYAKCAKIEVFDCNFGINSVIPGKTKLPVGVAPQQSIDENA